LTILKIKCWLQRHNKIHTPRALANSSSGLFAKTKEHPRQRPNYYHHTKIKQEPCYHEETARCSEFLPTPKDSLIVISFRFQTSDRPKACL